MWHSWYSGHAVSRPAVSQDTMQAHEEKPSQAAAIRTAAGLVAKLHLMSSGVGASNEASISASASAIPGPG